MHGIAFLVCGFFSGTASCGESDAPPLKPEDCRRVASAFQDALHSGEPARATVLIDWEASSAAPRTVSKNPDLEALSSVRRTIL